MYQVIATDDFVNLVKELPLKHIEVLSKSFVSIKKITDDNLLKTDEYDFMNDLLVQIRNQEIE